MQYKLIDTAGQITAVITSQIKSGELPALARLLMAENPRIEQVGYLQGNDFRMMGGELSINALLAGAFLLRKSGEINGYEYQQKNNQTALSLPSSLVKNIQANYVYLQGISYQVRPGFPLDNNILLSTKSTLARLTHRTPAAGIIYYSGKKIKPLVYVKSTDTYVWENACGSGSLAYSLITGNKQVTQPSGQTLSFKISQNKIAVTATVKEL